MNIREYVDEIENAFNSVRYKLSIYLKSVDYTVSSKTIIVRKVASLKDLEDIPNINGFYIILSDYLTEANKCTLKFDGASAIYRGQAYHVKDRLKSHLFNSLYKADHKSYKTFYKTCMQVVKGIHGVDVDQKPYSKNNWYVIVHRMPGSSESIKELTELAFDDIHNKPIYCYD